MGSQTSKPTKRPAKRGLKSMPKSDPDLTRISSQQGQRTDRKDDEHQSRSDELFSPTPSSNHHHHQHNHDRESHSRRHHHHHQHQHQHHHHHEPYPTLTHNDHLHHRKLVINRWPTMDPEALQQNNRPKSFYDEYIKS